MRSAELRWGGVRGPTTPAPPACESLLGTGPDPDPSPLHSWALKSPDGRGHPTGIEGTDPRDSRTPSSFPGVEQTPVKTRRGACPLTKPNIRPKLTFSRTSTGFWDDRPYTPTGRREKVKPEPRAKPRVGRGLPEQEARRPQTPHPTPHVTPILGPIAAPGSLGPRAPCTWRLLPGRGARQRQHKPQDEEPQQLAQPARSHGARPVAAAVCSVLRVAGTRGPGSAPAPAFRGGALAPAAPLPRDAPPGVARYVSSLDQHKVRAGALRTAGTWTSTCLSRLTFGGSGIGGCGTKQPL